MGANFSLTATGKRTYVLFLETLILRGIRECVNAVCPSGHASCVANYD